MRILIWLRNDLRLDDHLPLCTAAVQGHQVLPIYVADERWTHTTRLTGFPQMGAHRRLFYAQALEELRDSLRALGTDLFIVRGLAEDVLPKIAQAAGAQAIWFHTEQADFERQEERRLASAAEAVGLQTQGYCGGTLYHPDDLPFGLIQLPSLFTEFKNKLSYGALIREPMPAPTAIRGLPWPKLPPDNIKVLNISELYPDQAPAAHPKAAFAEAGGEKAARERVQYYFEGQKLVSRYKHTRNGMVGRDYSSKFSPYLAAGCVSPRRVYDDLQRFEFQHEKNESTYWLYFELLWRDFFRFVGHNAGGRLFRPSGLQQLYLPWRRDEVARADFERWRTGKTGYPLVDAAMRELLQTGYTSNRARQIVASFLTKNLFIDWRWGAEWFESQLIDYEPCSNYGNWSYGAGVGNDGRTFRYFDLATQASKYDADGRFVRTWLPEIQHLPDKYIHQPYLLSTADQQRYGVRIGYDYPSPMVDLQESLTKNEAYFYSGLRLSGKRPGNSKRPKTVKGKR